MPEVSHWVMTQDYVNDTRLAGPAPKIESMRLPGAFTQPFCLSLGSTTARFPVP